MILWPERRMEQQWSGSMEEDGPLDQLVRVNSPLFSELFAFQHHGRGTDNVSLSSIPEFAHERAKDLAAGLDIVVVNVEWARISSKFGLLTFKMGKPQSRRWISWNGGNKERRHWQRTKLNQKVWKLSVSDTDWPQNTLTQLPLRTARKQPNTLWTMQLSSKWIPTELRLQVGTVVICWLRVYMYRLQVSSSSPDGRRACCETCWPHHFLWLGTFQRLFVELWALMGLYGFGFSEYFCNEDSRKNEKWLFLQLRIGESKKFWTDLSKTGILLDGGCAGRLQESVSGPPCGHHKAKRVGLSDKMKKKNILMGVIIELKTPGHANFLCRSTYLLTISNLSQETVLEAMWLLQWLWNFVMSISLHLWGFSCSCTPRCKPWTSTCHRTGSMQRTPFCPSTLLWLPFCFMPKVWRPFFSIFVVSDPISAVEQNAPDLPFVAGNLAAFDAAVDNNNHVTAEAKQAMTKILNHDFVTGRSGSTPVPTYGDPQIWNQLKNVMLDPYYAPLLATDLGNLPASVVYTVEDVLKNDGTVYAQRLKEAGNKVEHFHYDGGFHGILSVGFRIFNTSDARVSDDTLNNIVRKYLWGWTVIRCRKMIWLSRFCLV